MLILSRKLNETIVINNNIEVTISAIEGDKVKVAIHAPREVNIYRKEIYLAIQKENKQASNVSQNVLNSLKNIKKE